jgi:hypothetical protein
LILPSALVNVSARLRDPMDFIAQSALGVGASERTTPR